MCFDPMNNKENAGGFLCTDEERLLISRATELSVRGENSAVALSFLTPGEQRLVFSAMERAHNTSRLFFWGGCIGAERRRAIFLPEWLVLDSTCHEPLYSEEREMHFLGILGAMGMDSLCEEFVSCVKICSSGYAELSHRDYLGALMALGIKRSTIGDICVVGRDAYVFCTENAGAFIVAELKKAGRETLKCEMVAVGRDFRINRSFAEICTTVASPRLDGTVRALCNVSREEALLLVTGGSVEVNYFLEKEPDRGVVAGDILSVRGFGKYIVDRAEDQTRRGRIRLIARKYT